MTIIQLNGSQYQQANTAIKEEMKKGNYCYPIALRDHGLYIIVCNSEITKEYLDFMRKHISERYNCYPEVSHKYGKCITVSNTEIISEYFNFMRGSEG